MKTRRLICAVLVCVLAGVVAFSAWAADAPSVQGTWKLVSRTLPDGSVLKEPDVIGFTTYTKDKRDVLFVVKGDDGNYGGLIIRSKYSLTEKAYTEENLAFLKNFGAKTIEVPLKKGTSPVTVKGGRIGFALPTAGNSPVVVEGDSMTVGVKGKEPFDVYKKVK
ncbi:hypothetical protein QUF72_19060 [Desulfobacterales bacterium HSG2]|nr:hypothetical protein [Desulfobacterales bacterium HSG2]